MPFLEFTVRAGGRNTYAGTLNGVDEASTVPLATFTNGGYNSTTNEFVPAGGANPVSAGVASGMYVCITPDGTSTFANFFALIDSVSSNKFRVDVNNKIGTAPASGATGWTANIGGAWGGPSGNVSFPFNAVSKATMSGPSGYPTRINIKADKEYGIDTAMSYSFTGGHTFEGYQNTFGDGGMPTITRSPSGASIILLTFNCSLTTIKNICFKNNGTSGTSDGVVLSNCKAENILSMGHRANGILATSCVLDQCGAFNNNQSNSSAKGGITIAATANGYITRCVASGNYVGGFVCLGTAAVQTVFDSCISTDNYGAGFSALSTVPSMIIKNCDIYNNKFDGITFRPGTYGKLTVENCNILRNRGYGINIKDQTSATNRNYVEIMNNKFGSGIYVNTSGNILGFDIGKVINNTLYPLDVNPWVDIDTYDFRLKLPESRLAVSYQFPSGINPNNVSYKNIGAVESPNITFRNIMTGGGL